MTAISAVRRQMKEMSDGTIRCYIDIDMHCKDDFLANFPIDSPIAIARLTQQSTQVAAQEETIEADKPKGGFISQWCAMRCNEPEFWRFLESKLDIVDGYIESKAIANECLKDLLTIESKTELDNDIEAENRYHSLVRLPYQKWLAGAR